MEDLPVSLGEGASPIRFAVSVLGEYLFIGLFPQPTRARPSVEYVPAPCRARQS